MGSEERELLDQLAKVSGGNAHIAPGVGQLKEIYRQGQVVIYQVP